jgi:hypothetical protein
LNTNGIQTSGEGIENVFVNNMVLGKKKLNVDPEKTFFHASLLGNKLNKFKIGIGIWYDQTPWDLIVVLLKLISMNHCH